MTQTLCVLLNGRARQGRGGVVRCCTNHIACRLIACCGGGDPVDTIAMQVGSPSPPGFVKCAGERRPKQGDQRVFDATNVPCTCMFGSPENKDEDVKKTSRVKQRYSDRCRPNYLLPPITSPAPSSHVLSSTHSRFLVLPSFFASSLPLHLFLSVVRAACGAPWIYPTDHFL